MCRLGHIPRGIARALLNILKFICDIACFHTGQDSRLKQFAHWGSYPNAITEFPGIMRAVIQRVSRANVTVHGTVKGAIQTGLLILLAVEEPDTNDDIEWLSGKIVRLRIFKDRKSVV